ncbi:MAG: hypothetical protein F4148_16840, partial [Caldilineaceae bacterium SB0675_bin_29]|nr:hypothetical protein [Caldilineaceae bacterium SB0675_bin_29]
MSQTTAQETMASRERVAEASRSNVREAKGTSTPIVVAENIHKTFRSGEIEVYALRGLDLTIGTGEM